MEYQCSFPALSVNTWHTLYKEDRIFGPLLHGGFTSPKDSDDDMSVVVLAEHPSFRILAATERFAGALGFTASELTKSSLRVAFGPETDVSIFKKILGESTLHEEAVWLYKKNGDELRCSVRSRISNNQSSEVTCTITLVSHVSVSSMKMDQQDIKAIPNDLMATLPRPTNPGPSICSDPALLAHLSAIRRSRRHTKGN